MATEGTYYLNASTLETATSVFVDIQLTTYAPNGYYSNGTVTRELVDGVLGPEILCPTEFIECTGSPVTYLGIGVFTGIAYVNLNVGNDTGAVVFKIISNVDAVVGISAEYNNTIYNALYSQWQGLLQSSVASTETYIGLNTTTCPLVAGSPHILSEYELNSLGTLVPLGTTKSVSIVSGQLELTSSSPLWTAIVIPKTTAEYATVRLRLTFPCEQLSSSLKIFCPTLLTSYSSSFVNANTIEACADTLTETYYILPIQFDTFTGTFNVGDVVFEDAYGQTPLGAGYYKVLDAGVFKSLQVNADGVVINKTSC